MSQLLYLKIPAQDGPFGGNANDRILILRILEVHEISGECLEYHLGLADAIAETANPVLGSVQAIFRVSDRTLRISWVSWVEDRTAVMSGMIRADATYQVSEAWCVERFPIMKPYDSTT